MSVHSVLARSSLGVVCGSLGGVRGLQKIRVRAFARLRVGPTCFSIRDRYLIPTFAVHTGHVRMQRVTTIAPFDALTLP